MDSKYTPFCVVCEDVNRGRFAPFDIMPYLISEYKSKSKKNRPLGFEEVKEFVINKARPQFWSRVEYELILSPIIPMKDGYNEKWNVFQQIMMNVSVITNILMDNLKIK